MSICVLSVHCVNVQFFGFEHKGLGTVVFFPFLSILFISRPVLLKRAHGLDVRDVKQLNNNKLQTRTLHGIFRPQGTACKERFKKTD